MFGFMDRNQDGRVTEDEVPSSMRDRLRESGVDLRRGLNQEEMGRAFERARQQRESSGGSSSSYGGYGGYSGGFDRSRYEGGTSERSRGDSERSRDEGGSSSGNRNRRSGPYVSSPKPRLTVDMPISYAEGDLDGDGQIGFYEWRKWRRNQTENFFVIDSNSDGFLTPGELNAAPAALAAASRAAATTLPAPGTAQGAPGTPAAGSPAAVSGGSARRPFPGNPPPQPQQGTAPSSSPASAPPTGEQAEAARRKGESMFGYLDVNKDGSVDEAEWSRSRLLKPQFQKRGIDLTRPMTKEVFLSTYVQINAN
jgi:Ca2+-binding EF-hand superfamily protein